MRHRIERHLSAVFAVAAATFALGLSSAVYHSIARADAERWVAHTNAVITQLGATVAALDEAESDERGFVLSGNESFIEAFEHAGYAAAQHLDSVRTLVVDNPVQQHRVDTIAHDLENKRRAMRAVIAVRRARGLAAAADAAAATDRSTDVSRLLTAVREVADTEQGLLVQRRKRLAAVARNSLLAEVALGGGSLAILALAFSSVRGARRRRRRAERNTAQLNAELQLRVNELIWRGREAAGLQRLSDALQLCLSPSEAHAAVARILPTLADGTGQSGFLAVTRTSRNLVECVASWGEAPGVPDSVGFPPEDCCALRVGQPYEVRASEPRMRCPHVGATVLEYVCLPLAAHGETLGVLHVDTHLDTHRADHDGSDGAAEFRDRRLALLEAASKQIAVALANLALRERLRQQTIRDPLTGAFNRRYLEETIEREATRSRRTGSGFAVMMLDVDHFKRFNDQHGHEAGDHVLRSIVDVVRESVREEDVVCRYGGEEFAILLPDIAPDTALTRAQAVVDACRDRRIAIRGQLVGPVTVSVGVATFQPGGADASDTIRRADAALYAAKRAGRDRVGQATTSMYLDLAEA